MISLRAMAQMWRKTVGTEWESDQNLFAEIVSLLHDGCRRHPDERSEEWWRKEAIIGAIWCRRDERSEEQAQIAPWTAKMAKSRDFAYSLYVTQLSSLRSSRLCYIEDYGGVVLFGLTTL